MDSSELAVSGAPETQIRSDDDLLRNGKQFSLDI